jgi:hypothetical protein
MGPKAKGAERRSAEEPRRREEPEEAPEARPAPVPPESAKRYRLRVGAGPVTNVALTAKLVMQPPGASDSDHATAEDAQASFAAREVTADEWGSVWCLEPGAEPLLLLEGWRTPGKAVSWEEKGTEPSLGQRLKRALRG